MNLIDTKFIMSSDINGFNGFGLPFTINGQNTTLAAGVAQSFTVPSGYPWYIAIFSYTPGSNIWVNGLTTATLPGAAVASGTSQLNPTARIVAGGSTISVITSDLTSPFVNVLYYVAPPFIN